MKNKVELPDRVSAKALGSILNVSDRMIRSYAASGIIPASVNGLYNLSGSVQAIISKAGSKPATENEAARAALSRERAEAISLSNAKRRGDLVPLAAANAAMDIVLAEVKGRLLALPASVTRDRELRRKLDVAVTGILNSVADALAKQADELEAKR